MGRDKAALPAGDGSLVDHLARRLRAVVDEVIVVGGSLRAGGRGRSWVGDKFSGMGPLAGIHAGLLAAGHDLAWVVACDLPDVQPALLGLLRAAALGYEVVVPLVDGEPQGVCALYQRSLAGRIEDMLRAGDRSVRSLLAQSKVRYLAEAEVRTLDPELRSFRNLNTPADYDAWLLTLST
jgi:molybdopterin-guanine dinucleotide biosynthesis protein A